MTAQHTPGPWQFDAEFGEVYAGADLRDRIADVDFFGAETETVGNANGELIAAAPDLLAALKHAVHWHDQLNAEDIARMQAAIRKAEGGV